LYFEMVNVHGSLPLGNKVLEQICNFIAMALRCHTLGAMGGAVRTSKRHLHNTISTRNEGSACLGGRICLVAKSLQNLCNKNIYQYTQMVNAPTGGQAGAARCCHRAKCLAWRLGYTEVLVR
jgi:hypothetical protein